MVGITGTHKQYSQVAQSEFILFHSAMIKREVFKKIGMLDEAFTMGAGEDTDFCIRAIRAGWEIVDVGGNIGYDAAQNVMVGTFPIWHKGGSTVKVIQGFADVFAANGRLLQERYGVKDAR